MDWKTTYPSVATVNEAGNETLLTWERCLPPPQTDVERAVLKRINRKCLSIAEAALRDAEPEIADKFDELMKEVSDLLGVDAREL